MSATHLILDNDSKFTAEFEAELRSQGVEPTRLPIRSPNLNAHCERFVLTIKQECLDHFVVFGQTHFDHIVSEFVQHYHAERPHQGLDNRPPSGADPPAEVLPFEAKDIICHERLGGFLKHYELKRAA